MLARDLQLTPGPRKYLASASQGPPAYSRAPGVPDFQLTPGPREYLASASQGPPAYSWAPGVPSYLTRANMGTVRVIHTIMYVQLYCVPMYVFLCAHKQVLKTC